MKIGLGRPAQGGFVAAALLTAAITGAGAANAAPDGNNGRHLGQSASTAPTTSAAPVRNEHAEANAAAHASAKAAKASQKAAQPAQHNAAPQAAATHPAAAHQHTAHGASNGASNGHGAGNGGAQADPPGNNGTVKIAQVGDLDHIPNNVPHPGCAFEVQWYGFDAGSDVVSTVSFTPQAPTSDVTISVDGPTTVPVGEDAASGAGTATGLDAVADYRLSFSGGAPAKQGYHVRLTVATPRSLGNDTKTKVFWVAPCAPDAPATPAAIPAIPATPGATPAATPAALVGPPPATATPMSTAVPVPVGAPPAPFTTPPAPRLDSPPSPDGTPAAGVPTNIDAGEHQSLVRRVASSPWGIALVGLGLAVVACGLAMGLRRRA